MWERSHPAEDIEELQILDQEIYAAQSKKKHANVTEREVCHSAPGGLLEGPLDAYGRKEGSTI